MANKSEEEILQDIATEAGEALEEEGMSAENIAAEDDPLSMADELDQMRAERDAYHDKFMRALAEAENVRKRADRDRRDAEAYGGGRVMRDLLGVHDNLRRALGAVSEEMRASSGPIIEGVELTQKELIRVFEKHGLKLISPQIGDMFDPSLHEAMFEAPVPGTVAGEIIQVSAEGAQLHERLLRPAQVGVSSFKE